MTNVTMTYSEIEETITNLLRRRAWKAAEMNGNGWFDGWSHGRFVGLQDLYMAIVPDHQAKRAADDAFDMLELAMVVQWLINWHTVSTVVLTAIIETQLVEAVAELEQSEGCLCCAPEDRG